MFLSELVSSASHFDDFLKQKVYNTVESILPCTVYSIVFSRGSVEEKEYANHMEVFILNGVQYSVQNIALFFFDKWCLCTFSEIFSIIMH